MSIDQNLLKEFAKYCAEELKIHSNVTLEFINTIPEENESLKDWASAGAYMPSDKVIYVRIKDRNIADVMRTLAHELTHHKQNELQMIKLGQYSQDLEDQANVYSGRLVRQFGKKHPEIYG